MCISTQQEPSCVTQALNLATSYLSGLAPPPKSGGDTCEREFAPNAGVFFSNTLPFACLGNDAGESCLVQVAQALAASGAPGRPALPPARPRAPCNSRNFWG